MMDDNEVTKPEVSLGAVSASNSLISSETKASEVTESAPEVKIKGPTYPIYLYESDTELPKTGRYYLVTKSGIYFHKETKAGSCMVPVKGIPWLETPNLEMKLNLPKVPGRIIAQALTFFRKVFDLHNSESYVTLLYSSKLGQYRLWCPKQKVSHGSVNYDRTDQPTYADRIENDWQMVGTIHSHCDFSAFHSGTDVGDEATFDGIHITLGHVNLAQISMAASVAINEQRETLEPEQCCTGVVRVSNKKEAVSKWMSWKNEPFYFDIELSEEDAQGLVGDTEIIESEWMPKVEKESWGYYKGSKNSFGFGGNYQTIFPHDENESNVVDGSGSGILGSNIYTSHRDLLDGSGQFPDDLDDARNFVD